MYHYSHSYVCWYDLTTDSSNLALLIPSTRRGNVRVRAEFSTGIFEELVMLVYILKTVTMGIDKDRKILVNYVI